ncbi:unnamed protein product, partial [marine sediment metagenome]
MSRVCVLLPVFNREAFIGRALESLRVQTSKDFDVFIHDDGSIDNTVKNIGGFFATNSELNYTLTREKNNQGQNFARNHTLRAALDSGIKYDYVASLDSDDVFLPDHLRKNVKFLDENAKIDVVYSDCGLDENAKIDVVYSDCGLDENAKIDVVYSDCGLDENASKW